MDRFDAGWFLRTALVALLSTWVVCMFASWVWAGIRIARGLPLLVGRIDRFPRPVPWGLPSVASVCVLYVLLGATVYELFGGDGAIKGQPQAAVRGTAEGKELLAADGDMEMDQGGAHAPRLEKKPPGMVGQLVQLAIVSVLTVLLVPPLLRLTSGATLADLGLGASGAASPIRTGIVGALLATPVVLAIQAVALHVWQNHSHPVEQMLMGELSPATAALAIISTMVLAPLVEELLFRGVMQRWLIKALSADEGTILEHVTPPFSIAKPDRPVPESSEAAPPSGPLPVAAPEERPSLSPTKEKHQGRPASESTPGQERPHHVWLGMVLTSIVFASLHLPHWPAPIALFVLSMVLGVAYQITGSLRTVIVLHGTFNGFSTAVMLLTALEPHAVGVKDAPPPAITPASAITPSTALMSEFYKDLRTGNSRRIGAPSRRGHPLCCPCLQ